MEKWKTKTTSHKKELFGFLLFRNAKKTHATQIILQRFLLCLRRNVSQSFKGGAAKTFSQVCMLLVQLASMNVFLFHMITGRRYSLHKFTITQRIFANTALLRSLK